MLLNILLVFHILVCMSLILVVLMQRSEGGALGMGGGPTGFMSARGAGDVLTRITWSLFATFLVLSMGLTLLGARAKNASSVADRLKIAPVDVSAPPATTTPPPAGPGLSTAPADIAPAPLTLPPAASTGPQLGLPSAPVADPSRKPAPKP